jgi:hypothetical protein
MDHWFVIPNCGTALRPLSFSAIQFVCCNIFLIWEKSGRVMCSSMIRYNNTYSVISSCFLISLPEVSTLVQRRSVGAQYRTFWESSVVSKSPFLSILSWMQDNFTCSKYTTCHPGLASSPNKFLLWIFIALKYPSFSDMCRKFNLFPPQH